MYSFDRFISFAFIASGLFLFLYASYDLLWRIALMCIGLFLINQGIYVRGSHPLKIAFMSWSNRFRF